MEKTNNNMEIYIIAYNNLFCVEYQIKTFKSYCKDDHKLIIVDANCGEHLENSEAKKKICDDNNIEYIRLPNELSFKNEWSSVILGAKLNYVYSEIVKKRKPKYFAFLDQDFFPFAEFSVKKNLDENGMYGDVMEKDNHEKTLVGNKQVVPWVLHPWLSFYRYDFLEGYDMDWRPCSNFDTGGANWDTFISKKNISKETYWLREKTIMYFPWLDCSNSGPSGYENEYFIWNNTQIYGQVQIYDNKFIHMLNSKYLDDPFNPKTNWCKGFLDAGLMSKGYIKSKY
jgi:hypothetical protein